MHYGAHSRQRRAGGEVVAYARGDIAELNGNNIVKVIWAMVPTFWLMQQVL